MQKQGSSERQPEAHTPGPWCVYPESDGTEICAVTASPGLPVRQIICTVERGPNFVGNALVLGAALELAEALRPFANFACDVPCDCFNCRARAALAKAGLAAA